MSLIEKYLVEKIKLSKYKNSKSQEPLEYVVYDENTLGYLFKNGTIFMMGVLQGNAIKGGRNWKNGSIIITQQDENKLRKATQKDFDEYRVSSKGYLK